jgi:hypothetical protein
MGLGYKVSYKTRKHMSMSISLILGLFVVLSFQNCSDLDNSSVVTVSDVERSVLENLPFAYDLKVDQMAYMSCSGNFAKQDARSFTIKAGGYFPGSGVGLRSNFLSEIDNLNSDAKTRSLALSTRNDQAGVVMNFRPRSNLQDYLEPTDENGEITTGKLMFNETQGILLSNERVAKQLIAQGGSGNYLNYVAGIPGLFNKSFDGVLRISQDSATEDLLRNLLRNTYYLTFGYAESLAVQVDTTKPYRFLRSPYNTASGDSRANTSVFGTGYVLNFQQQDARMSTAPPRVMTVQSAVNLENNSSVAESWDCSERFIVVRPEDASRLSFDGNNTPGNTADDTQVCDTGSDAAPLNINDQRRWDRIRNVLPVEDWYVRLPETVGVRSKPGCIVPKGNDFCYDMDELTGGQNNPNIRVAYYRDEFLNMASPVINYNGTCGPGTFFVCPHVVTVCYKR